MTYPSHWGPGEYGVKDPNSQPYDITFRSLADFVKLTEGTGAHVVAWLQDFTLGVTYGPAEVRAQIEAARDAGVDHFLLWDAATTYTRAALSHRGTSVEAPRWPVGELEDLSRVGGPISAAGPLTNIRWRFDFFPTSF